MYKLAFVGNPNTGKSTLINALAKNHKLEIGNWSGVTIEKKTVKAKIKDNSYDLTDLPGLYSFDDINPEALLTQREILKGQYDLFINVIDATNLEQNLFLTFLLMELNLPCIVVLNYSDLLKKYKYDLDIKGLQARLRCPCVLVSAQAKDGVEKIFNAIDDYFVKLKENQNNRQYFFYTSNLNQVKNQLMDFLKENLIAKEIILQQDFCLLEQKQTLNFYAIRILENSQMPIIQEIMNKVDFSAFKKGVVLGSEKHKSLSDNAKTTSLSEKKDAKVLNANVGDFLINKRYKWGNNIAKVVIKKAVSDKRLNFTLKLDRFFLNKWLGLPIFFIIIFLAFVIIFSFATPLQDTIQQILGDFCGGWIYHWLGKTWYSSLIVAGILGGFGVLLSFIPLMLLLFVFINILKESGYMSRVSHLLDTLLTKINLNGRAVIPLILGFGCNVGSVYATRSIANKRQRKLTAMVAPFMSCSSRMPIYGLFVAAFFVNLGGIIIFALYLIGILVALMYCLFSRIFFGKFSVDQEQFFELPPYHIPSLGIVLAASFRNIKGYIFRAATIILGFSIFLWLISYFPNPNNPNDSILAVFSHYFGYIFYLLGFGNVWQLVAAIIPAIIAKEVTISSLGVFAANAQDFGTTIAIVPELKIFGLGLLQSLENLLPNNWFSFLSVSNNQTLVSFIHRLPNLQGAVGNLKAFNYMMFMLLTIPCVTTLGALKHEFGYKVMLQSTLMGVATPYILCLIVYQIGQFAV